MADYLLASLRKAREQGVVGWRDDGLAIVGPWGFDVHTISVATSVWHGREDAMVPLAHGEWLSARIPDARSHLLDGQGHISLWSQVDAILVELKELAGA